ncbi:transglycosylase domain-containing protein [Candidatus Woesearchaeota archaeon]|nr:transglycosylase domain-containing protein [Candidatus Woesearchaeota archaeon]
MEKRSFKNIAKKTAYAGIVGTTLAGIALLTEFETGIWEKRFAHGAGLVQHATGLVSGGIEGRPVINLESIQTRVDEIYAGMKQVPNIIIHDSNSTVIGEFYNLSGKIDDINENKALKAAVVAAEDRRFYDHFGWDVGACITAGAGIGFSRGDIHRGCSTITIQLADSLYDDTVYGAEKNKKTPAGWAKKAVWKTDEFLTAAVLEQVMSKDDVLKLYMNNIDFGFSARDGVEIRGVYAASEYYFGKEPGKLDYVQSAFLAAAIQKPSTAMRAAKAILSGDGADDNKNVIWLKERVNKRVLTEMYKRNFVSDEIIIPDREYHEAMERVEKDDFGFKENKTTKIAPEAYGFVVETKQRLDIMLEEMHATLPEGSEVHVYTGLDLKVQEQMQAEMDKKCTALNKQITGKNGKKFKRYDGNNFNGAGVEIDTRTQNIVAMIDGCTAYEKDTAGNNVRINYKENRATTPFWDPGSMIKGIWDMIAFQNGFSLDATIVDEKRVYRGEHGEKYSPGNFEGGYSGKAYTLKEATCKSINSIFVELGYELCTSLGEKKLVEELNTFGYDVKDYKIPYGIGAFPAALTTVAGSYSIIAENGTATHYRYGKEDQYDDINMKYITKIGIRREDEQEVIFAVNGAEEQVVAPEITAHMDDILQCVVQEGTGQRAQRSGMDIRGKTGTARGNLGFVGYTRQENLLALMEFGLENPGTSLPKSFQGGRDAAPPVADTLQYTKNERGM